MLEGWWISANEVRISESRLELIWIAFRRCRMAIEALFRAFTSCSIIVTSCNFNLRRLDGPIL